MLMRTRQRVTRRTILAGTMSGGMKKETWYQQKYVVYAGFCFLPSS